MSVLTETAAVTRTSVQTLDEARRCEEVVRLLSGTGPAAVLAAA